MKKIKKSRPDKVHKSSVGIKLGIASFIVGSMLWVSFGKGNPVAVPAYTVERVIDGDTFVTAENQYVRIASIQAPEMDMCGGKEAKEQLESLILGKPIYLKSVFRDMYGRMVSLVYVENMYINEKMLKTGYAYYLPRDAMEKIGDLKNAGEYAREHKLGIFSTSCTQDTNIKKQSCNIKGNVRNGNIYYLPDCGIYHNTTMQLYLGDRWFCSEKEAIAAGFRKPEQCK